MSELRPEQFDRFFQELYLYPAMNWQMELAAAACEGKWPDYICLPTGAGKTSSIDIAVFALAFQAELAAEERTAAMRTFLAVDRRTVVSESFYRAKNLQARLANATDGILKVVADRLRSYSGAVKLGNGQTRQAPLSVVELRGGIYRDPAWCHSLVQPMIVTSTVDQIGSRLLFRGYGVSNSARPIQAAAIAHDSLIILDEAHISPAFSETLGYVQKYQQQPWAREYVPLPMQVVEMTATPPSNSDATKLEINPAELADPASHIGNLVNTSKWTKLEIAGKVKGAKAPSQLAAILVAKAIESVAENRDGENGNGTTPRVVGIMCNMVATAKEAWSLLQKNKQIDPEQIHLIIGAMRPVDRDKQTDELRRLISTGANRIEINRPVFVVATQCIEVGADYDFDVLVTEAAPLDSLVQRFGRLNRGGRPIDAIGYIVMREDRVKEDKQLDTDDEAFKMIDPIYGNAMSRTWNWLVNVAKDDLVDFGIAHFKALVASIDVGQREKMSTDRSHAPVLLPAHLDLLCQTSLDPWPDPDVSPWLHGPQRIDPEVQVCWRADLFPVRCLLDDDSPVALETFAWRSDDVKDATENVIHTVSLCPPSSSECLSIPLRRVQAWLMALAKQKKVEADLTADLPAISDDATRTEGQTIPSPFRPIAWRGVEKSEVIHDLRDIRPGDTLVFPVTAGGWTELGFVPAANGWSPRSGDGKPLTDVLQAAAEQGQRVVECHRDDFDKLSQIDCGSEAFSTSRNRPILRLHPSLIDVPRARQLYDELRNDPNFTLKRAELKQLIAELPDEIVSDLRSVQDSLRVEFYAGRSGIVISGPRGSQQPEILTEDDGSDLYSRIAAGQPVELSDHLEHVRSQVVASLSKIPLDAYKNTLLRSAEVHDWGKADPRFQAMLLAGDLYSALWETKLYAKSAKMPGNLREREFARGAAELPKAFRHEMLSMSLIETTELPDSDIEDMQLLLHLIASHHGHARPWAPVCDDPAPPDVSLDLLGLPEVSLSETDRQTISYHQVDSAIIDRFWQTTTKYGWWGTVFLECVLRLADRRASQIESQLQATKKDRTAADNAISVGIDT